MNKKIINGQEYVLLNPNEVDCNHDFSRRVVSAIFVNPGGEFVVGHGSSPLYVDEVTDFMCVRCGMLKSYYDKFKKEKETTTKRGRGRPSLDPKKETSKRGRGRPSKIKK